MNLVQTVPCARLLAQIIPIVQTVLCTVSCAERRLFLLTMSIIIDKH